MSQANERGEKAFTVNAAIPRNSLVKLSAASGTQVEVTGSDEKAIGVVKDDNGKALGDVVTVALLSSGRTFKMIAKEAHAAGASLFSAVAGKVQDTDPGAGTIRYTALEAATGDNSVIEVLPL